MTLQAGDHQSNGTGRAAASNRALAAPSIPGDHCKPDCWLDKASLGPTHREPMPLQQSGEAEHSLCTGNLHRLGVNPKSQSGPASGLEADLLQEI